MTRHMDLGDMMGEMVRVEMAELIAMEAGLERVAKLVEKTAKAEFGTYQDAAGEFPAWQELAQSTQDERERLGYSANEPLLRTGDLRDTISHETRGLAAVIGSTSDVMVYHEVGTSKMPPRPVLGPAAYRNKDKIEELMAASVLAGFVGADVAYRGLGYEYGAEEKP